MSSLGRIICKFSAFGLCSVLASIYDIYSNILLGLVVILLPFLLGCLYNLDMHLTFSRYLTRMHKIKDTTYTYGRNKLLNNVYLIVHRAQHIFAKLSYMEFF
ncbi:hypothetical protein HanOQP8_Chr09g0315281 [Helianthus annuus]|nr:hypothetical protein HanOQP8_Chr09g0315281 [Helianthus annuus]